MLAPIVVDDQQEVPIQERDKTEEFVQRYKIDPQSDKMMEEMSQMARRRFLNKFKSRIRKSVLEGRLKN